MNDTQKLLEFILFLNWNKYIFSSFFREQHGKKSEELFSKTYFSDGQTFIEEGQVALNKTTICVPTFVGS